MTYTALVLIAVPIAIVLDLFALRTNLLRRKAFWVAYAILLAFQLITNGILTGSNIVRYNEDAIVGVRVAWAPIEDLGFGFALILLTLSCWVRAGRGVSRSP